VGGSYGWVLRHMVGLVTLVVGGVVAGMIVALPFDGLYSFTGSVAIIYIYIYIYNTPIAHWTKPDVGLYWPKHVVLLM
jgi:hypothetical protein